RGQQLVERRRAVRVEADTDRDESHRPFTAKLVEPPHQQRGLTASRRCGDEEIPGRGRVRQPVVQELELSTPPPERIGAALSEVVAHESSNAEAKARRNGREPELDNDVPPLEVADVDDRRGAGACRRAYFFGGRPSSCWRMRRASKSPSKVASSARSSEPESSMSLSWKDFAARSFPKSNSACARGSPRSSSSAWRSASARSFRAGSSTPVAICFARTACSGSESGSASIASTNGFALENRWTIHVRRASYASLIDFVATSFAPAAAP